MLSELLVWIEGSSVGEAIRGASFWTYGILNLLHVLGLSTLFGSILLLDLRLLGLWRSIPLVSISRPAVPIAAAGFVLAVLSGVSMISVNATEYIGNPFMFLVKFPAIACALLNVAVLHALPGWRARYRRPLTRREEGQLAASGAISLLLWLTAIIGGRMVGYW